MEYVRQVDFAAIDKSGADERLTQSLFPSAVMAACEPMRRLLPSGSASVGSYRLIPSVARSMMSEVSFATSTRRMHVD